MAGSLPISSGSREPLKVFCSLADVVWAKGLEVRKREVFWERRDRLRRPHDVLDHGMPPVSTEHLRPEDTDRGKSVRSFVEASSHCLPREGPSLRCQRGQRLLHLCLKYEAPVPSSARAVPDDSKIVAHDPRRVPTFPCSC